MGDDVTAGSEGYVVGVDANGALTYRKPAPDDVFCPHCHFGIRETVERILAARAAAPDGLREAVEGLLGAIDRAARLSGRAAEHPEALSIRAEAERVRAVLAAHPAPDGGDPT